MFELTDFDGSGPASRYWKSGAHLRIISIMNVGIEKITIAIILSLLIAVLLYANVRFVIRIKREGANGVYLFLSSGILIAIPVLIVGGLLSFAFDNHLSPLLILGGALMTIYNIVAVRHPYAMLDIGHAWGWPFSGPDYSEPAHVYLYSGLSIPFGIMYFAIGVYLLF